MDLPWPEDGAVNSSLSSHMHLNSLCQLTYPTIDQMVVAVEQCEKVGECFMYKVDLERAFRNLRVDPTDYMHLGSYWNDGYYIDTGITFGLIWGGFFVKKLQIVSGMLCNHMDSRSTTILTI